MREKNALFTPYENTSFLLYCAIQLRRRSFSNSFSENYKFFFLLIRQLDQHGEILFNYAHMLRSRVAIFALLKRQTLLP